MIDLHVHSTASDGTETPSRLIEMAKETGLSAIALTDHDTVSGLQEFLEAGKGSGIKVVPGVEISSWDRSKEIHIVGLFIDPEYPPLVEFLEKMREERAMRNRLIIHRLQNLGYKITEDEVFVVAGGESIGRPHIAQVLMEKGYFENVQDVFDALLKRGKRGYIARSLKHPDVVCSLIHEAGGVAIWAHPVSGQHSGERAYVKKMLKGLIPAGLDGMETFYTTFNRNQTALLEELAETNQLLRSGGSDFHGTTRPFTKLGTGGGCLSVPDSYLEMIETYIQNRNLA